MLATALTENLKNRQIGPNLFSKREDSFEKRKKSENKNRREQSGRIKMIQCIEIFGAKKVNGDKTFLISCTSSQKRNSMIFRFSENACKIFLSEKIMCCGRLKLRMAES